VGVHQKRRRHALKHGVCTPSSSLYLIFRPLIYEIKLCYIQKFCFYATEDRPSALNILCLNGPGFFSELYEAHRRNLWTETRNSEC
jgi:hypothetical protein